MKKRLDSLPSRGLKRGREDFFPLTLLLACAGLAWLNLGAQQPHGTSAGDPQDRSVPVSPARISEHEIEQLATMAPQEQAARLLERAINHYDGALELIAKYVDGWLGKVKLTPEFGSLITTAINSNDLRVRAAALEIDLAANNLPRAQESVDLLIERTQEQSVARPWCLWMLGALGFFKIEPERVLETLLDYQHDPSEDTRMGVVAGLGHLGADNTIQPLLDIYLHDKSTRVRSQALGSIAQVGMLSKQQRLSAVPDLLRLSEDMTIEAEPRKWIFQALRDVTGADLGNDAAAWRAWWAEHGSR
jgi:hypothetical protein